MEDMLASNGQLQRRVGISYLRPYRNYCAAGKIAADEVLDHCDQRTVNSRRWWAICGVARLPWSQPGTCSQQGQYCPTGEEDLRTFLRAVAHRNDGKTSRPMPVIAIAAAAGGYD